MTGSYAKAVDLADEAVPGTKNEILSGAMNATDAQIMNIAKAAPEERQALVEKLKTPKEPKPYIYKKRILCSESQQGCYADAENLRGYAGSTR